VTNAVAERQLLAQPEVDTPVLGQRVGMDVHHVFGKGLGNARHGAAAGATVPFSAILATFGDRSI
jgi:hypothetical protein